MPQVDNQPSDPVVTAIEDASDTGHRQAISIRVGPVYNNGIRSPKPGIWLEYQEDYLNSLPHGPVLLDEKTWNALDKAVRYRLRRWNRSWLSRWLP
jgi:hypothetical protein